jgi:hypothetical protein
MKIKIATHIHYVKWIWETEGRFELYCCQLADDEHRTYVCAQEIEIDVPENYDPRAQQIAALEKQKQKAMANFQKSVDEINEKISKLQALEYTA